jgi:uncharacterized membrane protein YgdD (TMEM256/DUF423 family)
MLREIFFILGGFSGGVSVALGAFGAHALKSRLRPVRLETFETGVHYQMIHALALLGASYAASQWPASSFPSLAGWLFFAGTLLFSGSLYLLVLSERRWLGAITPFGGLAFIAGWVCLALAALGQ